MRQDHCFSESFLGRTSPEQAERLGEAVLPPTGLLQKGRPAHADPNPRTLGNHVQEGYPEAEARQGRRQGRRREDYSRLSSRGAGGGRFGGGGGGRLAGGHGEVDFQLVSARGNATLSVWRWRCFSTNITIAKNLGRRVRDRASVRNRESGGASVV